MIDYTNDLLNELSDTLPLINENQFNALQNEMLSANKVIVVGVGRVMLSLKAWVKRFKHLGIDINYFGSETEDRIGTSDLVIIGSSSGETLIPKEIAIKAKAAGARVFYIGSNLESSVSKVSDNQLYLVSKTNDGYDSKQPMSTLFEQQLYLLGDILTASIMDKKSLKENDVILKHANLE